MFGCSSLADASRRAESSAGQFSSCVARVRLTCIYSVCLNAKRYKMQSKSKRHAGRRRPVRGRARSGRWVAARPRPGAAVYLLSATASRQSQDIKSNPVGLKASRIDDAVYTRALRPVALCDPGPSPSTTHGFRSTQSETQSHPGPSQQMGTNQNRGHETRGDWRRPALPEVCTL